tara:strand:- start:209 stop:481 length:273 start_codon:yes stop_codon:yes gene_type:complete
MEKSFNDIQWRQKMYENKALLSEANGATTQRSLKNVRDLYEDTMMGIEMAIDEPHGSPIDKRAWSKIDDEIQKQFIQMERWIKKHKAVLK